MYNAIIIDLNNLITVTSVNKALVELNKESLLEIVQGRALKKVENKYTHKMVSLLGFNFICLVDAEGVDNRTTNNSVASLICGVEEIPSRMVLIKTNDENEYLPLEEEEVEKLYEYIINRINDYFQKQVFDEEDLLKLVNFEEYKDLNKYSLEVKVVYDNSNPLNPISGCYWECYPLYKIPCRALDMDGPHFPYLEGAISIESFNLEKMELKIVIHHVNGLKGVALGLNERQRVNFKVKHEQGTLDLQLMASFKYHTFTTDYNKTITIETKVKKYTDKVNIKKLVSNDSEVYRTYFEEFIVDKVSKDNGYVRLFYMTNNAKDETYHYVPVYLGKENISKFSCVMDNKTEEVTRTIKIKDR